MARLLPPSTNDAYDGSPLAARVLVLLGVLTVIPGCIHVFLPDGGAGTIAGIDLGVCREPIVALFAWAGATQIAFGVVMVLAGLRYRTLVPLVLLLLVFERGLHAVNAWVTGGGTRHHPPEHFVVLLVTPLALVLLALSLRSHPSATRPG